MAATGVDAVRGGKGPMEGGAINMGGGKAGRGGKGKGSMGKGGTGEAAKGAVQVGKDSWAEVVRKGGSGGGTKAKAKPQPPARKEENAEENLQENDEDNEEEIVIPPAFMEPIPRTMLEARRKVLEDRVAAEPKEGDSVKKVRRTRELLEITREQLKEAGGGSEGRKHFSIVNANKKIQKLQMAQRKAHEELEDIAAAQDLLDERRKQGELNAQRLTRLLENEKGKYAYMAKQLERESRAQLQAGAGFRRAVEVIRGVIQQAQRMDAVGELDKLETLAQHYEPSEYDEGKDPLLLGLDISEESEDEAEEESDSSSETTEMDYTEVQRGKKRQWGEGRWTTAEERDNQENHGEEGEAPREKGRLLAEEETGKGGQDVGGQVETARAELGQATGILQYVAKANAQIAEQGNLQIQQEREIYCRQAAREIEARVVGANPQACGQLSRLPPNPRLDIEARRKRLAELRACSEGGRKGFPREEKRLSSSSSGMEIEDKEAVTRRKDRRRKENSRSPRGRRR